MGVHYVLVLAAFTSSHGLTLERPQFNIVLPEKGIVKFETHEIIYQKSFEFDDDTDQEEHKIESIEGSDEVYSDVYGSTIRYATFERVGKCYGNATFVEVTVDYPEAVTPSKKLYSVCHDENISATLYSESYIDGKGHYDGLSESGRRPSFKDTDFFLSFRVRNAYRFDQELETFTHLLDSEELAQNYLKNRQYQLARGHLFPNGDPISKIDKDATFHYINVVPQWQILNGGNWKSIEDNVRKLGASLRSNINVWTGSFDVLTLQGETGNSVEMWMGSDPRLHYNVAEDDEFSGIIKKLPIPKYLWKVIYFAPENAAVAIVQINNPWVDYRSATKEMLCSDICDSIQWLQLNRRRRHNPSKGFTFCCDVDELRKIIPYVPTLNYTKILADALKEPSSTEEADDEDDEHED